MLTPSFSGMDAPVQRLRVGGALVGGAASSFRGTPGGAEPMRRVAAPPRVQGMMSGKLKASGKPRESIQVDKVAISKPVKPRADLRTSNNSCGLTTVISVAVLPNLGV